MKEKLRSSKGMTLTELLVALAIVSLIGVSLTVGINSAVKVYRDATQLYEAETLCGTILTYLEDEFRFGRNIKSQSREVIFDSQDFGKDVKVSVEDGKVLVMKKDATDTASASKLLGDSAYTSGLMVLESDSEISYDKAKGQVTITIAVGPGAGKTYVKHTVKVAPVYN